MPPYMLERGVGWNELKIEDVESDIKLLGVTAIEDRLQDNVPSSVESFLKAGIKVWMLTGDKCDVAEKTAVSSGIIQAVEQDEEEGEEEPEKVRLFAIEDMKQIEQFQQCLKEINESIS